MSTWGRIPFADSRPFSLPSCGIRLGNQRLSGQNRVGQSTSPPLYLWFTVGDGGLGFGTMVRTSGSEAAVGV